MLTLMDGVTDFICGMCDGADLEFADIIVKAKKIMPNITLEAAIPFKSRLKTKNPKFHELLEKCNKITFTSEEYHKSSYFIRNKYIVENTDRMIAIFNGKKHGGTFKTIAIATKKNRNLRIIDYKIENMVKAEYDEIIGENEAMSREELNYKTGYSILFNGISEQIKTQIKMIKQLMILQRLGEETCISERKREIKVNTDEFIKQISEIVQQNLEEDNKNN